MQWQRLGKHFMGLEAFAPAPAKESGYARKCDTNLDNLILAIFENADKNAVIANEVKQPRLIFS